MVKQEELQCWRFEQAGTLEWTWSSCMRVQPPSQCFVRARDQKSFHSWGTHGPWCGGTCTVVLGSGEGVKGPFGAGRHVRKGTCLVLWPRAPLPASHVGGQKRGLDGPIMLIASRTELQACCLPWRCWPWGSVPEGGPSPHTGSNHAEVKRTRSESDPTGCVPLGGTSPAAAPSSVSRTGIGSQGLCDDYIVPLYQAE